jgi:hypothetical protein
MRIRHCALIFAAWLALASPVEVEAEVVNATLPPAPLGSAGYIQQSYGLTALSASSGYGDTVAIITVATDYTSLESDLDYFRSLNGLRPCTTASGCLRIVGEDGSPGIKTGDSSFEDDRIYWRWETALDVQAVSAICPHCRILVVQAASPYSTMTEAEATAYRLGADQVSHSFQGPPTVEESYIFNGMAAVASSGDEGYISDGWGLRPSDLPRITAAGGTSLHPAQTPTARGVIETAWYGSGSSCARTLRPAWQPVVSSFCDRRATSDLSAVADPDTGLNTFCTCDGFLESYMSGGTSLSSPLIAAYYALLARKDLGVGGASWAYSSEFLNDITTGLNGECSDLVLTLCQSVGGFDGPTGNGSISGAVVPGAPGVSRGQGCYCYGDAGSYVIGGDNDTAWVSGGVFPNRLPTSYWWEVYDQGGELMLRSQAKSAGTGADPVLVQDALDGINPEEDHIVLVAQNSMGTVSYGGDVGFRLSVDRRSDLSPQRPRAPLTTVMFASRHIGNRFRLGTAHQQASVRINFAANRVKARFECSLNDSPWRRCASPVSYRLAPGRYQLRVRARSNHLQGPADRWGFQVVAVANHQRRKLRAQKRPQSQFSAPLSGLFGDSPLLSWHDQGSGPNPFDPGGRGSVGLAATLP